MSVGSLPDWLAYIERQHPQSIALGLDRVRQVFSALKIKISCPVVTVGGTNGKGSTCAMLESVLGFAGYRTGLYTSPHLLRYNERVRIAGREAEDATFAEAFAEVESARGSIPLTYFEFGTLAAFVLFSKANLDAAVLEVGLGGRLDAVNVVDADCAVLTSVGIDHVEFLGDTRETIGAEKAGIFRAGRPAVVADPDPPRSVLGSDAKLLLLGRDFGYQPQGTQWSYWGPAGKRSGLAHPALRGAMQLRNASAAFAALDALREKLPIAMQDVRRALAEVTLPGRFQVLPGRPQVVLDVAHNPEAAAALAANLGDSGYSPETIAVFGMLRDKDIAGVVRAVASRITRWHLATLPGPRGADAGLLAGVLRELRIQTPIAEHGSVAEALAVAKNEAAENDKIVVFGSFLTVAGAYG
ncbi:MAG TPA: bifunctional tetrahydrofolate synthase/dihydrofolate synthase [Burkholderiales bacterium]|nr:bifunctional tetrahydrofolate synthase/dihydrofolate synthase [Burkholderiales bacterium]